MCDAFLRIAFDMRFGSGKPPKNLSKTMPERPKNRLRELCFFRRRFFWASAQFWSNLGVQNGTQNCSFGTPKLRRMPQSTAYSVRIAFYPSNVTRIVHGSKLHFWSELWKLDCGLDCFFAIYSNPQIARTNGGGRKTCNSSKSCEKC